MFGQKIIWEFNLAEVHSTSHLAPPIAQLATPTPLMLCVPHTWEWCGRGLGSGQALLTKAYFRLNFVYVPSCYSLRSDATALGVSGPVLPMSHDYGNDYDHNNYYGCANFLVEVSHRCFVQY